MEQGVKPGTVAESLPAKVKRTGTVQNSQIRPARNLLANIKCPESCLGAAGNLPVNPKKQAALSLVARSERVVVLMLSRTATAASFAPFQRGQVHGSRLHIGA
jgi:hypothetical protein